MENVKAKKGYAGPVVVCAAYFSPVAGFIPSRTAIKYLSKQREMEIWLAPIAGTRVLVPYRAQSPTPVGQAVLEASEFISVPLPARASANGVDSWAVIESGLALTFEGTNSRLNRGCATPSCGCTPGACQMSP
jgi:hypothetical protein